MAPAAARHSWSLRLGILNVELRRGAKSGRTLAIDSGALNIELKAPARGLPIRSSDYGAVLLDDETAAARIKAGDVDHLQLVHIAGPGRFYSLAAEARIGDAAERLAAAFAPLLALPTPAFGVTQDAVEDFFATELKKPIRRYFEVVQILEDHDIDCVRIPICALFGAWMLRSLLNRGFPKVAAPERPEFEIAAADGGVEIDRPQADAGAPAFIASQSLARRKRDPIQDQFVEAARRAGADVIFVRERPEGDRRAFRPRRLFRMFRLGQRAGAGWKLSLFLAAFLAHLVWNRAPRLLAAARIGAEAFERAPPKRICVLDVLRRPGVFFALGARAATGQELVAVNRHLQLADAIQRWRGFDEILDGSGGPFATDGDAKARRIQPHSEPTLPGDEPVEGPLIFSQPLTHEIAAMTAVLGLNASGSFQVRLHPNDGPAAAAYWSRTRSGSPVRVSPKLAMGPETTAALGATSTALISAALRRLPVVHALSNETLLRPIWPDGALMPGIHAAQVDDAVIEAARRHNAAYVREMEAAPTLEAVLHAD